MDSQIRNRVIEVGRSPSLFAREGAGGMSSVRNRNKFVSAVEAHVEEL